MVRPLVACRTYALLPSVVVNWRSFRWKDEGRFLGGFEGLVRRFCAQERGSENGRMGREREIMVNMETPANHTMKKALLGLNCIILAIGNCGGPLVMRLYFVRGGKRIWFSGWLETGGWPIIFIPLTIAYLNRLKTGGATTKTQFFSMKPRVFIMSAAIGVLTGLVDYLYAYGVAKLLVSTSAFIVATQLAFTAGSAFLLVKQKFTGYSINAIVLLTVGARILGLHTSSDGPEGESNKEYLLGFFLTLAAAALYGLILPLVELMYLKAKQAITYTLVLEIQMVMCFFATAFCTVGMLINKDFQAISREAKEYELGEGKYYLVVVWSAIVWQCFFLGAIGVIFYSSSLLSAIIITGLIPVTEVLAAIFYHEKFQAEKGVSLFLSLWSFISYFCGEMKHNTNKKNVQNDSRQTELTQSHDKSQWS
ncbi:purine permease 3-like [Olea europaea subsp. europaea]|uniref:Probable purine permease n=1 Tax=Olea europaea subsp. europaea TaxID=158383 RepID=A0A8S0TA98_OLEEU|nr:purine permease 3-like [Olea europaea subsp. europaea]